MALKGHTRIELTNVETGEVEVHEDDNMVTNALSKLLGSYGVFCNNPISVALSGLSREGTLKALTGGLMLFDTSIEENAEIIHSPAGVSMVGCGSQASYSGANKMAGSYNAVESGWTDEGGYKYVWDFATHQANGTIACASLTTNAGGKITEGCFPYSSDYAYNVGSNIDFEKLFNNSADIYFYPSFELRTWALFADGVNNRVILPKTYEEVQYYKHSGTSSSEYESFKKSIFYKKSIDLSLYRFGFSNFSIFYDNISSLTDKKSDTITVEMPDELKNIITQDLLDNSSYYWQVNGLHDENNIYIVLRFKTSSGGGIDIGETLHIWQINATTFESSYFSFTNNLEEKIYFNSNMNNSTNNLHWYIGIMNDYILCCGASTNQVYIINKNNNMEIHNVTDINGNSLKMSLNIYYNNGEKFFIDSNNIIVIDPITKKYWYKNVTFRYLGSMYSVYNFLNIKGTHYATCVGIEYNDNVHYSTRMSLVLDPTLLVTINNLETPVQKTSAQTMKVTYVLTQE